jgi:hypothetical protein
MSKITKVYLCHKCGGALSAKPITSVLYDCDCMSGWVRDWQVPVILTEAHGIQLKHTNERLALYREQGRASNGHHILSALARLARLTGEI